MDISLDSYKLIKYDSNSIKDLNFIRGLFADEEVVSYLGHLENDFKNVYIVSDYDGNYIGYVSLSEVIVNMKNLTSSTIYYAIDKKYRGMGHGSRLLKEVSKYKLIDIDMLVMMIDVNNMASLKAAEKAGFGEEFRSDEEVIYTKYSIEKRKQK